MPIDHVNALPPGTRFEEYRLDAVLGAGGFGITYRAYDANLDKFVAIKEYLPSEFATRAERYTVVPQSSTDAQDYHWGLNRFLDEARTLARFNHPHLNKVYRFFESNGTAYMVLEYVEGETLADRLTRERQLPEESLQRLMDEVLSGLEVMHEAGYVHRDIKPGNLMLREDDGSAVILDFGAARQAVGQRSKAITSILTPGYAPIEQYDSQADDVGPWSDIYALAMVAYRCISGTSDSELPDAVTRGRTQRKGGVDLTPAVETGKGRYNAKLLEAIDWAMEVDEENRPQTVDAWRQALSGGGRRKGPARSVKKLATRSTRTTTTGRNGPSWTAIALTMATTALLVVGAWWGWKEYPELFGKGPGGVPPVTEQAEIETAPPEVRDTGEAASAEQTLSPDKAEAVQPSPKLPALSPEEAEVARLLAAAEADLKARRLTSPAGNNAWEKYLHVLSVSPTHPEAVAGMEQVIESYMELFSIALGQEDLDKATGYLAKVRELHPDSPSMEEGEQRLEATKQAHADRLAEQQRQRQAELERQRIAKVIEEHWQSFAAALGQENLSEAANILRQVRDLKPEDPGLAQGEQRLEELERQLTVQAIKRHWEAFETAIGEENVGEATDILEQIRDMNPNEPGLAAGEQRLEATQAELERKRQEALERELAGEMVSIPGNAFRIGKYEVTVGQFRRFVEATGYRTDAERNTNGSEGCVTYITGRGDWAAGRSWQNPGYAIGDNQPVACVSWNDAQAYIAWLTEQTGKDFRLPSDAEWEYAARAGSTTSYHYGNDESRLCLYANHADTSTDFKWRNKSCSDGIGKSTAPVGRYRPNGYGLYDVHGNVGEWLQDCGEKSGAEVTTDCDTRELRGGSWHDAESYTSFDVRSSWAPPSFRENGLGFRLVQDK